MTDEQRLDKLEEYVRELAEAIEVLAKHLERFLTSDVGAAADVRRAGHTASNVKRSLGEKPR